MYTRTAIIALLLAVVGCKESVEADCEGPSCDASQTGFGGNVTSSTSTATNAGGVVNAAGGTNTAGSGPTTPGDVISNPNDLNSLTPSGGSPRGNATGDVPWVSGYAEIATAGFEVSGHVEYSISVSASVSVVPQEELISFIQTHADLFSSEQYSKLTTLKSYLNRGHGAELLLDMLGLVFGNDADYFRTNPKASIVSQIQSQKDFLAELSQLDNKLLNLKGEWIGVHDSVIPASGRLQAEVTRIKLPDGSLLSAIDTALVVTDQNGGTGDQNKAGQAALGLFSSDGSAQAIELSQGYARVAKGDTELGKGQQATFAINQAVECVDHEHLVAFIKDHNALFSGAEYQTITQSAAFGDATQTSELLTGLLGVKLGSSWGYFAGAPSLQISAYDQGDQDFVNALFTLQNQTHTLSGSHTAIGVGTFGAIPYLFAPRVRLTSPDGHLVTAIGMHARVADEKGKVDRVTSQDNAPALQLTAN